MLRCALQTDTDVVAPTAFSVSTMPAALTASRSLALPKTM